MRIKNIYKKFLNWFKPGGGTRAVEVSMNEYEATVVVTLTKKVYCKATDSFGAWKLFKHGRCREVSMDFQRVVYDVRKVGGRPGKGEGK